MKRSILILLLAIPYFVQAQNYQDICSPGVTFFGNAMGTIKSFRRDAFTTPGGNDTLFFSFRAIRDTLPNPNASYCRDTTSGSVFGIRVRKTGSGWFYFFNKKNDTVFLNATAAVNQAWKFVTLGNGAYLQATVSSIAPESFLGVTDPVKTITLQAKNSQGQNIAHIFNGREIRLSQHYGMVKFFDVYNVPCDTTSYLLKGRSSPPVGLQELSWQGVYGFDPGDEFHYEYSLNEDDTVVRKYTAQEMRTILSKYSSGNNLVYQVIRCRHEIGEIPVYTLDIYDTIQVSYDLGALSADSTILRQDEEFLLGADHFAPQIRRDIAQFNHRLRVDQDWWLYQRTGCWNLSVPTANYEFTEYAQGLGQTYYRFVIPVQVVYDETNKLVYYRKGNETWGTPVADGCYMLLGTGSSQEPASFSVTVVPNPAGPSTEIRVSPYITGKHYEFRLFDSLGRRVRSNLVTSASTPLNVAGLSSGIYFYTVESPDGSRVATGKIMVP
jgi:hypothetical protein